MTYKLRPYTEDELEFIYQTKKEAYKYYVEKFWGPWNEEQQRSFFADFMSKVQNSLQIIECDNKHVGIYHGEMLDDDTYEIGNIILIPEYQATGIGKDILANVIKEHPKSKMHLQVFKDNPAINLYKRLDFVVVGETRTHHIMERQVTP